MNFNAKCACCGRFMSANDFILGHCEVEPLSEFGSESIEWTCRRCAIADTHPEDGDAPQIAAPFMSGGGGEANRPTPNRSQTT